MLNRNLIAGEWVAGSAASINSNPRAQGRHAREFYTSLKIAYARA